MKVIDHFKQSQKPFISFEILPPLKGKSIDSLYDVLDPLMEFHPPFINVTYHRYEYIYKERENGLLEKVAIRKRPGTVGICAAITHRYKVDTVAHLICGGFSNQETEDALIDMHYLGIDNIIALRGDPPKNEKSFKPDEDGHSHAIELTKQIMKMNKGIYLEDDLKDGVNTNFCVGVAGYPEKHFEAPNINFDLKQLKAKVDAGAEYIITQMFFDNSKYFEFVKSCRKIGIDVPIIPGLKTLTSKTQLSVLPSTFHIDIPDELYTEMIKCKNHGDYCQVGAEWSIKQAKELIAFGVPCVHFFTMGNIGTTVKIARGIF